MQVIYSCCAGLDVHQATVTVCLFWRDAAGQRHQEVQTFPTMTKDLEALRAWLQARGCQAIAMESTGPYWQPIWNVLVAMDVQLFLVNPSQLKRAPGRKTDVADSVWLADRLEAGALEGSYVPEQAIRDAREVTRYRRRLVQQKTSEVNRLQKILESANIKLACVASDVLGVTGRALLQALVEKKPLDVAALAKGQLRRKQPELEAAMQGHLRPHHYVVLKGILDHLAFLEQAIEALDAEVARLFAPHTALIALLCQVPGIQQRSAEDLLAEIGTEMTPFPTHQQFCSWAAMCPGNKGSGGKQLSGKTRKGNRWLRGVLVECAHSAAKTRGTYLSRLYHRLAGKKGSQRAAVAVGHSLLTSLYYMVRDRVAYQEPVCTMTVIQRARKLRHHLKELESLGYQVELTPVAPAA